MSNVKSKLFKNNTNKLNKHRNKLVPNFWIGRRSESVCSVKNESIYEKIETTEDMDTYTKADIYRKKDDIHILELFKRCNILNTVNHLKIR
jgi:hypothetical protein